MQMRKSVSPKSDQWSDPPPRYWSSLSEDYASGDVLSGFLSERWQVVDNKVLVETVVFGQDRRTHVYHFVLQKGNCRVRLAVTENPFVNKVVTTMNLTAQHIDLCSSNMFGMNSPVQQFRIERENQ